MQQAIGRRILIGDVHGHYNGLMKLLEAIAPGSEDRIYFLGDLVDRGPKSRQVVEFVKRSGYQCLLGNHEQLFIDAFRSGSTDNWAFQAWLYSGGRSTLASYEAAGNTTQILTEHLQWLQTLPLYLDLGDVWLVHAGVDPNMPIDQQGAEQFCWIRDPFHRFDKPIFQDKLIVTGHTITFNFSGVEPGKLVRGKGWLDIDTGAYHHVSGWLTGLDIDNQRVYQTNVFQKCDRTLPLEEATALLDVFPVAG